jgi:nucleoid DNA-binding protein
VTKQNIIQAVCEQLNLPKPEAAKVVQATFDALTDSLVRDGRVELRNFGIFQIKRREARIGRNPKTGEQVQVAPRSIVTFKPGKEMEARVRELDGAAPQPPHPATTAQAASDGTASS